MIIRVTNELIDIRARKWKKCIRSANHTLYRFMVKQEKKCQISTWKVHPKSFYRTSAIFVPRNMIFRFVFIPQMDAGGHTRMF